VQVVPDVAYYEGTDADPLKHKLDLYLPKGRKDFPVIFFVHGGAWVHGDKGQMGIYRRLGNFWAGHGIGAVITNYRLTPKVTHPGHVRDVARAFAWAHRNIARYGGRADRMFVCGHSAGGHLVSLLATNESFLKAEGLTLRAIRGAIPLSGVYDIPAGQRLFDRVFGLDPAARKEASPIRHVHAGLPPFLIVYADRDLPMCGRETSEAFCKALTGKQCSALTVEAAKRNHVTLILNAGREDDVVAQRILKFVADHCGEPKGS
jgi:acetyl esterase/lipase